MRPNVGVAMSTLWITYADMVTEEKYEYICYFHDKKSPYSNYEIQGEKFAERCYENLFGSKEIVMNIINLFEDNPRMGMVGPPTVYHGDYFAVVQGSWPGNYKNTVYLAQKLGIKVNICLDKVPVAPYGDMFWFRAKALKKVIGYGFNYSDFDIEYKKDFTILHAIERLYGYAVQDSGYYYAEVINSDYARSELINLRYVLNNYFEIMLNRGFYPYNFEFTKEILKTIGSNEFQPNPKPLCDYKAMFMDTKLIGFDLYVTVKNISHSIWKKNQIRLALFSNGEATNIRGFLPDYELVPDEEAIISISLEENENLLSTQLEIQMVHEGLCFFGRKKRIGEYSLQRYDAEFVGCKAPDQVQVGESYQISVTMRNTGADTWREEDQIRLCIRRDGMDHGYRIKLNNGCEVAPGCEYQFLFDNFLLEDERSTILEFQMVKEGVGFFGESDTAFIVSKN